MAETKRYYSVKEVTQIFGVSEKVICRIETEGFIIPRRDKGSRKLFTPDDLERIRVILALSKDLGVNWAGVEVVLHMREQLISMQRQIDEILDYLHRQMRETLTAQQQERQRSLPEMDIIKILNDWDSE